jgi:hypothetical protein
MRIDSSGRVGIGKTPVTYKFEVNGGVSSNYVFMSLTQQLVCNNDSQDFNISSMFSTPPDTSNSLSFEMTVKEAQSAGNQLFRLFYIRIGTGTNFNISSAIVSFGSVTNTTTISYPSAGNIRFTNTSFSLIDVALRRISA